MNGVLVVREGGAHDIDAVMQVMRDSFDPSFGEAWTAPQCEGLLPMAGVWLTLAHEGRNPVGFALSRAVGGEAELLLLAVCRDRQRSGIGARLLREFIQAATRRGATRLHLEVRDGNGALNLYVREGFTEIGRRSGYYSGPGGKFFDALTLGRSVTS